MRRGFLLAILAGAFTSSASAQTGPGTIYYRYGSPNEVYRVSGSGTGNMKLGTFPPDMARSTAYATYPGGRELITAIAAGTIPGTTNDYGDITLYSEQNQTPTTVTNFRGPQYIVQGAPRHRFSNDQRDSFLSFLVYDSRTVTYILYRYNGPISDIFRPGFVRFTSDDPRLVPVTPMLVTSGVWDWDATGTKSTYSNIDAAGRTLISILDATTHSSTLVNNPTVSGMNLTIPWCSSTEFRLFGPATYKDGTNGIVSFYPATRQFSWVIQEGGNGAKKISAFGSTAISPDGTVLAFGMLRVVSNQTIPSLVRIPVHGGAYTPLVNFPANTENTINPGGLGWKW